MKLKDIPGVMLGNKEARFNKSETQWSINLVEANAYNLHILNESKRDVQGGLFR